MIRFPNCKINLGLHILEKLPDGYHRLETVLYPLELSDILEILPSEDSESTLTVTGINLPGDSRDNLCFRAWELFRDEFGIPPVKMHLHKIVPNGAGLGGGSSDAAFTLMMLNEMFDLRLTKPQLSSFAGKLGMDCPFFISNVPSLGTGKGDILSPVSLSLKGLHLLLVKPPLMVSTAEAYAGVVPGLKNSSVPEVLSQPVSTWKGRLINDFEDSIFRKYPEIKAIRETLYSMGALYAALSGSGSAVFGLFNEVPTVPDAFRPYFVWEQMIGE